jgi:hypothetical protein
MITRPITRPIRRSIIRSINGGEGEAGGEVTRFFTNYDSAVGTYHVSNSTLVFASGDTFEIDWLSPVAELSTNQYMLDGADGDEGRFYVLMRLNGDIEMPVDLLLDLEIDGVSVGVTPSYPVDGKLHRYKFIFSAAAEIKYFGSRYNNQQHLGSIFANFVATISGSTISWPLDEQEVNGTQLSVEGLHTLTSNNFAGDGSDSAEFTLNEAGTIWEANDSSDTIEIA